MRVDELFKILKYLRKRNFYINKLLNYGGEADIYSGFIINSNGNKYEKIFRIIKGNSSIGDEYTLLNKINEPNNIISYDNLIVIDNLFIFIMDKYPYNLKEKIKANLPCTNEQLWG